MAKAGTAQSNAEGARDHRVAAEAGQAITGGKYGLVTRNIPTTSSRWYGANPIIAFYVYGNPAPQGSKEAKGTYKVGNGKSRTRLVEANKRLKPWRSAIREAMESLIADIPDWAAIDYPVRVEATFTMPATKASVARGDVYHTGVPDLDKLERGLGDSIAPERVPNSFGKNKDGSVPQGVDIKAVRATETALRRSRSLLRDDSLIVNWDATKVYPGTTPMSLRSPGVFVAIYRA